MNRDIADILVETSDWSLHPLVTPLRPGQPIADLPNVDVLALADAQMDVAQEPPFKPTAGATASRTADG